MKYDPERYIKRHTVKRTSTIIFLLLVSISILTVALLLPEQGTTSLESVISDLQQRVDRLEEIVGLKGELVQPTGLQHKKKVKK